MTTRVTENVGLTVYNDFAQDLATSSGLTFGYKGGSVIKLGVMYSIPAGTLVLSADSTNIVYVDLLEAPTVSVSTIGNKPSRAASIFLYAVTTSGNQVSSVIDLRNWLTGSTTDENDDQPIAPASPQFLSGATSVSTSVAPAAGSNRLAIAVCQTTGSNPLAENLFWGASTFSQFGTNMESGPYPPLSSQCRLSVWYLLDEDFPEVSANITGQSTGTIALWQFSGVNQSNPFRSSSPSFVAGNNDSPTLDLALAGFLSGDQVLLSITAETQVGMDNVVATDFVDPGFVYSSTLIEQSQIHLLGSTASTEMSGWNAGGGLARALLAAGVVIRGGF